MLEDEWPLWKDGIHTSFRSVISPTTYSGFNPPAAFVTVILGQEWQAFHQDLVLAYILPPRRLIT